MAKRLYGSYALALALSQALWVLPGAREAVAHPGLFGSAYEWFVRVGLAAKGPAGRLSC